MMMSARVFWGDEVMIYTKIGRVIAFISTIWAFFAIVMGMAFVSFPKFAEAYAPPHYGSRILEQGFLLLCIGLALGILTEISRSLSKTDNRASETH